MSELWVEESKMGLVKLNFATKKQEGLFLNERNVDVDTDRHEEDEDGHNKTFFHVARRQFKGI